MASLLLIHDLYPVPLETRVLEALDTVRPYMESHGGNVELLGDRGRGRAAAAAGQLQRLRRVAGDARARDQAGARRARARPGRARGRGRRPSRGRGGFELPMVHRRARAPGRQPAAADGERGPSWVALDGASELEPGALRALQVDGVALLVANVDGSLLAYRDACAACGAPLHGGELDGGMLRCAERAASSSTCPAPAARPASEPLQLAPVPLLETAGSGWPCERRSRR